MKLWNEKLKNSYLKQKFKTNDKKDFRKKNSFISLSRYTFCIVEFFLPFYKKKTDRLNIVHYSQITQTTKMCDLVLTRRLQIAITCFNVCLLSQKILNLHWGKPLV